MANPTFPNLPSPRGPRIKEGRPFDAENSDHSVNVGSFATTAGAGVVELAQQLLLARTPGEVPRMAMVKGLAQRLLWAADVVQASIRADGHVSRMAGSHTRARGAVRSAVEVYPLPATDGLDDDAAEALRATWLSQVVERALDLLSLGVALAATPFPVEPSVVEAPARESGQGASRRSARQTADQPASAVPTTGTARDESTTLASA